MKTHFLIVPLLCLSFWSFGQSMGIGTETPNENAVLELVAPDNDQGLLVPRLSTADRTASTFTSNLSASDNGLMVYDSDLNKFFFWIENQWIELAVGNLNGLPDQSTQAGKFLSTDGSTVLWADLDFNSLANVPADLADGDDNTQLSDADITSLGYLKTEVDGSVTNEIQDISFDGANLSLTSGSTVDLSVLQDGVGTDDQAATEVPVTATTDLLATDVQSALEELQSEVLAASSATIPDDAVTTAKITDGAITDAKISDVDFGKLTGVPTGLADGDDDTQLSDADITALGYLKTEVDGSITNEIQDISFDGANLSITSGSTVDLTTLQDGIGTDDQVASEVDVTPAGDLSSTDVQSALEELQSEIVDAASAAIPDNAVTTVKISNGAVTDAKISDVEFSKLTSVPAGLADGDDDTQLDETQVDAFVANNGYLTTESDPSVPANIKDGVDWTELSGIPADIADGDDDTDTQLTETEVDAFVANNGYLTSVATADIDNLAVTDAKINSIAYSKLTGVPSDIADGDDDTQLTEAEVDGFVANNGYLTSVATADINNSAVTNAKINSMAYSKLTGVPADLADGDDDTQLTETEVDGFVANNGYLTSVATADIDNLAVTNAKINSMAFSKLTSVPSGLADGDDNTQLTEAEVDGFVANNGYLTAVASVNITNGTIVDADISASAAIDGSKLAGNSVGAAEIETGGVGSSEIANSSIVNADISTSAAIEGGKIADNTITSTQLANSAVTTTEILDLTITNLDISSSAAIQGSKLASNSVTATQIATGGVGTSEILNGTITNTDISNSAAISGTKISPNFGSQAVTGGSFSYSSAESRTYSISPIEFVALSGIVEPHSVSYGLQGGEAIAVSGNSSTVQTLAAPLRIPDGATITRVRLYGRNFSSTAGVNVNLIQNSMSTGTTATLLFKIPSNTTGVTLFDSGTISYAIGQGTNSYQLMMEADAISSSGHSVTGAIITYEVSSPD